MNAVRAVIEAARGRGHPARRMPGRGQHDHAPANGRTHREPSPCPR